MAKEIEIYTVIDLKNLDNTKSFKTKKKICEHIGQGERFLAGRTLPTTHDTYLIIESTLEKSDRVGNIGKVFK